MHILVHVIINLLDFWGHAYYWRDNCLYKNSIGDKTALTQIVLERKMGLQKQSWRENCPYTNSVGEIFALINNVLEGSLAL